LFIIFGMKKRDRNGSTLKSPNPTQQLSDVEDADDGELASSHAEERVAVVTSVTSTIKHNVSISSDEAIRTPPATPERQASTGGNRAAFMQKFSPTRAVCNMDLCRAPPGTKVSICGVVIAVFPASTNPDRRYVQIADATGSVGMTVWNDNVSRFSRDSIGQIIVANKVLSGSHHGKKVLTMTRETTIEFPSVHTLQQWWSSLLTVPPPYLAAIQDLTDNTIVNVAGVLGLITEEVKIVGGVQKILTSLHLGDSSGELVVKSWNHKAADFAMYEESPVLIQRVRVSSFGGQKTAEFLDNEGSVVVKDFPGKFALIKYWQS
jgi:hypothetical protein